MIGFEVVSLPRSISAFSVKNSPYTQEVSTRNAGVSKHMGGWSKTLQPKKTKPLPTSSKMDSQSQNHLVVYPWGIFMVIFGPYD